MKTCMNTFGMLWVVHLQSSPSCQKKSSIINNENLNKLWKQTERFVANGEAMKTSVCVYVCACTMTTEQLNYQQFIKGEYEKYWRKKKKTFHRTTMECRCAVLLIYLRFKWNIVNNNLQCNTATCNDVGFFTLFMIWISTQKPNKKCHYKS